MARPKKTVRTQVHKESKFFQRTYNGSASNTATNGHAHVDPSEGNGYHALFADLHAQLSHKFETHLESAISQAIGKFGTITPQEKALDINLSATQTTPSQFKYPPSIHHPYSQLTPDHFSSAHNSSASNTLSPAATPRLSVDHQPQLSHKPEMPSPQIPAIMSSAPQSISPTQITPQPANPPYVANLPSQPVSPVTVPTTPPTSTPSPLDQGLKDKVTFLEKELLAAYQRESQLRNDIEKLQQQMSQQSAGLTHEIAEIKKEVNQRPPATEENKFASLSSQLSQVMQSMNTVMLDEPVAQNTPPAASPSVAPAATTSTPAPTAQVAPAVATPAPQAAPASSRKKKLLIIGAVIGTTLLLLAAAAWYLMRGGQATVDENLVNDYLNDTPAESTGANEQSDSSATSPPSTDSPTPAVQGASTVATSDSADRYKESYAEIDYRQTQWDTHKNPQLGIQFDYPINASNVIRTDTSVTVIRKTGYIFKVQYIESALDLEDYWQSIKARNLNYKVQPTTFRNQKALFLELEDISDYPGDRYLSKVGDVIYDIWYATSSKNLAQDDAKRVDIMLNSFKFLNAQEE